MNAPTTTTKLLAGYGQDWKHSTRVDADFHPFESDEFMTTGDVRGESLCGLNISVSSAAPTLTKPECRRCIKAAAQQA